MSRVPLHLSSQTADVTKLQQQLAISRALMLHDDSRAVPSRILERFPFRRLEAVCRQAWTEVEVSGFMSTFQARQVQLGLLLMERLARRLP